jgi:hypothetical protein
VKNEDRLLVGKFGELGWGGNSGFQALNLAIQFGVKKIILICYDMHLERGMHWHGKHEGGMNNPTPKNVERWRRVTDAAAPLLEALGIKVINCSMISALENYPKMSLREALDA